MDKPTFYQIKVKGYLDDTWAEWFEGLTVSNLEDGDALLSGQLPDQAALHGILKRIGSLSLTLIAVNAVPVEIEMNNKENNMNSIISQPDLVRRRILRVHGSFLLVLTVINTVLTMVGWATGKGPFALWQEIPFAAVGLFQAYLIMFVVGVALWFGSSLNSDLWKWDLIGLLAHLPPLAVNFIFSDLFAAYHFQSTSLFSIVLHTIWILVELFAILYKGESKQTLPSSQR